MRWHRRRGRREKPGESEGGEGGQMSEGGAVHNSLSMPCRGGMHGEGSRLPRSTRAE